MQVAVLGAGPTGCAAARLLTRDGHDVTLVDRSDAPPPRGSAEAIFDSWDRPAIGQFRQPHNLLGRGRALLRDELPDTYAALLAHGAGEVRQDEFLGEAPRREDDADLATIACRRPVIDAVLRAAVADEAGVHLHAATVTGLEVADHARGIPHVTGVHLSSGDRLRADLVLDATGRNSPANRWLAAGELPTWGERTLDCQLLYYSRHYRFEQDEPPYASILGGPRGDLGYLAFAVFIGDNGTFCLCIMAPAWEQEWRALRDQDAFERVARLLPGVGAWLAAAEPITAVLPMGRLRDSYRETVEHGRPRVTGLVPLGDARCHTNPTFAFGLSLGLQHAAALAPVLGSASDDTELVLAFERAVGHDAERRFEAVAAEDRDRVRLWSGEPLDPTDREQSMALFLRLVVYRVAGQDPELLRAVCRRVDLLDDVDALPSDVDLLDRAEEIFRQLPPVAAVPRSAVAGALRGV